MKKLIELGLSLFKKYKEVILYLVFGVLTTVVNFIVYFIVTRAFELTRDISIVIAWVFAIVFAYITNKIFVFESKSNSFKENISEIFKFTTSRIASLIMELILMNIFVEKLKFDDLIIKIIVNIIIIVVNYVLSKLIVFKKTK